MNQLLVDRLFPTISEENKQLLINNRDLFFLARDLKRITQADLTDEKLELLKEAAGIE